MDQVKISGSCPVHRVDGVAVLTGTWNPQLMESVASGWWVDHNECAGATLGALVFSDDGDVTVTIDLSGDNWSEVVWAFREAMERSPGG